MRQGMAVTLSALLVGMAVAGSVVAETRAQPRVEVVIPLELLVPAPRPDEPASPAVPATPDEPLVLDCRGLAERIEQLRSGTTVGTRQLRERRELQGRYRRACR
ncbi:hypothetical protein BWR19_14725 [Halomonas sp. 1513]|nr:hypothetical protein [Halomonas sp. 1513]APX94086.1 hypothetical protein BWR19_14725 [Halomonas sp. 1513]